MILHTLSGPFLYATNPMYTLYFLIFNDMLPPTSFFPSDSSNATMVENSIIFKTETSFYNMAYSLISLAHIPPLKTEK
jgi:hypothetical protein